MSTLAEQAQSNCTFQGRTAPLSLSANGVFQYIHGRYPEAIKNIDSAIAERRRWWPEDIQAFHKLDEARDLYVKAMALYRLAEKSPDKENNRAAARQCFENAEGIYQEKKKSNPYIEQEDILERIRSKTMEVLGISR